MPAKVFISCGQGIAQERDVARQLDQWFASQGFQPYVAIEVQSILDLNAGIIGELKTSDYYLFVNFRREEVTAFAGTKFYRGSLYTNQELAIAYALGFDHMLLINQKNATPEGVFKFIVTNIPEFDDYSDVLPKVQQAVSKAGWRADYTRQLLATNLRLAQPVQYTDHTGSRAIRTLHVDIRNERPDIGAVGCIARLARLGMAGQPLQISPDRSLLKVTGLPAYEQTVWPKNHGAFDLLGIIVQTGSHVFLNSALDVSPRQAIIANPGNYHLEYEVFSQGFPPLNIKVLLNLTGNINTANATLL
jgi:hypothetical protein